MEKILLRVQDLCVINDNTFSLGKGAHQYQVFLFILALEILLL